MKITLGFVDYVEKEFILPEKFEFFFDKKVTDDDYTSEQWALS